MATSTIILLGLLILLFIITMYLFIELEKIDDKLKKEERKSSGLNLIIKDYEALEKRYQETRIEDILVSKENKVLVHMQFKGNDLQLNKDETIDVFINGIELTKENE